MKAKMNLTEFAKDHCSKCAGREGCNPGDVLLDYLICDDLSAAVAAAESAAVRVH